MEIINGKKYYSLEEISNYIKSQDSLGDVAYNLNHEKIVEANKQWVVYNNPEAATVGIMHIDEWRETNSTDLELDSKWNTRKDAIGRARALADENDLDAILSEE